MRIYSNTILSWPQALHAFQIARLYPGRWHHYYFYKIQHIKPLIITTHSPLELLQENCQYYCYDKYQRNKSLEQYGNTFVSAIIHNKYVGEETWVHIPTMAEVDDIIAVRNDLTVGYPSTTNNPFNRDSVPSLAIY